MAYRRVGDDHHKRRRAWHEWINQNASELQAIGLPPEVYLDLQHWDDFVENGHLHFHPESSTGFDFGQLSPPQMQALLAFLEAEQEFVPENCPLKGWLHVRLGYCAYEPDEGDR